MIKRIINILLAFTLITVGGIFIYLTINGVNINRQIYARSYYQEYLQTQKTSYLLQSAILAPDKERGIEISRAFLLSRNYEVAEAFNRLYRNKDFYIFATETALFNHDYSEANRFLAHLPEGSAKNELTHYASWATTQNPSYVDTNAETENGKLMRMVEKKDFSLYSLTNDIGNSIATNNIDRPGKLENILAQAQTLANYGLPYAGLKILSKDDYNCATDYYLVKSTLYQNNDQTEEALTTIEAGLECDPVNSALLNQALTFSAKLKEMNKTQHYKERINIIQTR